MATSEMKASPIDYLCTHGSFIGEGNARSAELNLNPQAGHLSSYEPERTGSCKPELKPEWLHSKDATKRKRVNRTAKLKQCKLDARREQWLSQGTHSRVKLVDEDFQDTLSHKGSETRSVDLLPSQGSFSQADCVDIIQPLELGQRVQSAGKLEIRSTSTVVSMALEKQTRPANMRDINLPQISESDYTNISVTDNSLMSSVAQQSDGSVMTVPNSCLTGGRDCSVLNTHASPATVKTELVTKESSVILAGERICRHDVSGSAGKEILVGTKQKQGQGFENFPHRQSHTSAVQLSNTCTSSPHPVGSNDGKGRSHLHEGEDDWEAVADAIYMQGAALSSFKSDDSLLINGKNVAPKELLNGALQPEYKYKAGGLGGRTRASCGTAWRPDDAARPPTLPRLSKPHSFPLLSTSPAWNELHDSNLWGPPPAPLFCPICTEELDLTDSSFVPCSCGFRLCLFCHHRIAADDGRCPGCRKVYNTDVAMKLSRASNLWLHI